MIKIFSQRAYRFPNPDIDMIKGKGVPEGKEVEFTDAFFDTKPGEVQDAPDWIKLDQMWEWGVKDGKLFEIRTDSGSPNPEQLAIQAAARQAQIAQEHGQLKGKETSAPPADKTVSDLDALNKDQLIQVAKEKLNLSLSPGLTKQAMIDKIEEASAKATEAAKG